MNFIFFSALENSSCAFKRACTEYFSAIFAIFSFSIVVTARFQTFDDNAFLITGCNMKDYSIVALKSVNHFRAYFKPIADGIVAADTPGLRPANVKMLNYKKVLRPIYPLDEDAEYDGVWPK